MQSGKHIAIVGAGLVGSLLSIYLRRRGYQVSVFERRADMRKGNADAGRSINLALSNRGLRALKEVGVAEAVRQVAIPMHGRVMHDTKGNLSFLAYGKEGQFINSISRSGLNIVLMDEAEKHGVQFFFNHRCSHIDFDSTTITFNHSGEIKTKDFNLIIGADGAFSAVRSLMQITDRFNYSQFYIEHGYKELHIPAGASGEFLMEKNALHIWPRESFMLIALPNPDATFTCTLFFPFEGELSFDSLKTRKDVTTFLAETFPDAMKLNPKLVDDYYANPVSSLVTIRCFPWQRNRTLLIGDAAHGIVPFYGQGMNAGFEDCRILNDMLSQFNDNWDQVLSEFPKTRKPDTDAIAQLAFDNFVEMRDLVADPEFLLRKKIESKINALYPDKWIPLYSMVTFRDDIGYADAYRTGQRQKQIMDKVMQQPNIASSWEQLNFHEVVNQLTE
ncbi:MAG TPA: NAD(P)/FAD-dependent oxidoreductase [Chryseosolibacter sp.]|nr:NAD(P)/FAD-dependent oxidoreductase [Chryseosolibacter sp.]